MPAPHSICGRHSRSPRKNGTDQVIEKNSAATTFEMGRLLALADCYSALTTDRPPPRRLEGGSRALEIEVAARDPRFALTFRACATRTESLSDYLTARVFPASAVTRLEPAKGRKRQKPSEFYLWVGEWGYLALCFAL